MVPQHHHPTKSGRRNPGLTAGLYLAGMERPNLVVLMAGGLGTRLRPLTDSLPKPLIAIGGKPVLERIIDGFASHGFRRFVLAVGYRGNQIVSHFGDGSGRGLDISYVWDTVSMGTAGALGLIPKPDEPAFVMNGDILAEVDFGAMLRFHQHAGASVTVAAHEVLTASPYGVLEIEGSRLVGMVEKPERRDFVNAGIYVLDPIAWRQVKSGKPIDMPDLIGELLAVGARISAFPVWGKWIDIGRVEDLARAEGEFGAP